MYEELRFCVLRSYGDSFQESLAAVFYVVSLIMFVCLVLYNKN